jgi:hypothetical protein
MPDVEWPPLHDKEFVIEDDEKLWRQIHPTWLDGDIVTKLAFLPGASDDGQLSVSRESKVTAEGAFKEFVEDFGNESIGVLATNVVDAIHSSLRVVDDADSPTAPNPTPKGHAYIDFRASRSKNAMKRIASQLRDSAVTQGWQCGPRA